MDFACSVVSFGMSECLFLAAWVILEILLVDNMKWYQILFCCNVLLQKFQSFLFLCCDLVVNLVPAHLEVEYNILLGVPGE